MFHTIIVVAKAISTPTPSHMLVLPAQGEAALERARAGAGCAVFQETRGGSALVGLLGATAGYAGGELAIEGRGLANVRTKEQAWIIFGKGIR